jgi:phenylalanyl-tRNA synthetase beta chain
MKIAYSHLVRNILENPSIKQVSESLFQLGHEHEIEGDIFDLEFTPNRGDCLSVNGLLRDLSAFYTLDTNSETYDGKLGNLSIDFENLSKDQCSQISFLRLEIDNIPETYNGNLKNYFADLGLNKNNFFTDVSNYISYETGQPTHCYNASKMNGKLVLSEIERTQEFETLLDKKITLTGKNLVFTLNNEVINLAGVIGNKNTSCSFNTHEVIVECGFFHPESIIGKSVKYDVQSDAAHKFERGVDPDCQERVLRRFIKVVSEQASIKNLSFISHQYQANPKFKIPIDVEKVNKILGVEIDREKFLNYLSRLKFEIKEDLILVPTFRSDVRTQNDLAEEIARVIGYNNILPQEIIIPKKNNAYNENVENKARFFLIDNGFYEVVNSSLVKSRTNESIRIDNPLDSNRQYLRNNITDSLVDNLLYNERRQKDSIKLFEISDIYLSMNGVIKKTRKLSLIASGRVGLNYEDFSRKIDEKYIADLFGNICMRENLNIRTIDRALLDTKVKSKIVSLELNIDDFDSNILEYKEVSGSPKQFHKYNPISDLPVSFKDISYLVKDHRKTKVLETLLLNFSNTIIKDIYIFDYYKNEKQQEVKIGFRFIFQDTKSTITSQQIESVYDDIVEKSLNIDGITIPGIN